MAFTIKRTILFGDCDPAGIVYTPRIAHFVVEAVHEFLTHKLGGSGIRAIFGMNILPPARALSIEFLATMAWDDVIELEVSCAEVKTTSFTFEVIARNSLSDVAFHATMTQVCISPKTKRPIAIPESLRRALSNENNG